MNRKELIHALTKYELVWFIDNGEPYVEEISEFFANGGFAYWSNEELQTQYDFFIKEEI